MTSNSSTTSVLILIASMVSCADAPSFKITTKRSDDRIEVKSKDHEAIFVVRSPFGISDATIERKIEQWPDRVVIQLRLQGLEKFKISTEKLKLEASVSSQNGEASLWKDGKEDLVLNSKSPYWMPIRILDSAGEGTASIPLKDGCIELQLPAKFFEGNPTKFKLEWIDFYRS